MNDTMKMLRERSFSFAARIVKFVQSLEDNRKGCVLSRQLLKSGTSIGANIREARFAQSTADYVSKLSIALKEAEETTYWLELMRATNTVAEDESAALANEVDWLIGTLVNTVKANKHKADKP